MASWHGTVIFVPQVFIIGNLLELERGVVIYLDLFKTT